MRTAGILYHFLMARWRWVWLRGARLPHYQERRARRMAAFAWQNSPFYRRHWAGCDLQDWRALPPVDKRLMMANFDDFNTAGARLDEALALALAAERSRDFTPTLNGLTVGLSSGTSGHRGLFLVSPAEQAAWAGVILARLLPARLPPGGLRAAFFLRANSNLYEQTRSRLVRFRYFDLLRPWEESLPVLNQFQPHLLIGPPQLLGLLAGAQAAGKLRLRPQRLLSVAEVLEPQDRSSLESAFNCPVAQVYQATEGLLAAPCARGRLHIQEDLVALQFEPPADVPEPQTSSGLPAPAPDYRMPVVTDLHRRAQPILRYRLNDLLQLSPEACPCGSEFRVIETIAGRSDDILYFPAPSGRLQPVFPDVIRRMLLLAEADIQDYQAFQDRPGALRLHLQPPAASSPAAFEHAAAAVRRQVQLHLENLGCRAETIEIIPGLHALAPGAKRRRVQRLWTANPAPGE